MILVTTKKKNCPVMMTVTMEDIKTWFPVIHQVLGTSIPVCVAFLGVNKNGETEGLWKIERMPSNQRQTTSNNKNAKKDIQQATILD